MKAGAILAAVALACAVNISPARAEYYEAYWMQYCEDSDFEGDSVIVRAYNEESGGEYKLEVTFPIGFWRQRISSLKVYPETTQWCLYDDNEGRGNAYCDTGSKNDLTTVSHPDGGTWNDRVCSFRAFSPADRDWVVFDVYENANRGGDSVQYKLYKDGDSSNHVILISELDDHWNDVISSIQTLGEQNADGYDWYFYVDAAYKGGGIVLSDPDGEDDDLQDNGLNDRLTSLRLKIDHAEGSNNTNSVRCTDADTLTWSAVSNAEFYNMYRGTLSQLLDTNHDGLPDGGYGVCVNDLDSNPLATIFVDVTTPELTTGFFYVMSVVDSSERESGLGATSSGWLRVVPVPCP